MSSSIDCQVIPPRVFISRAALPVVQNPFFIAFCITSGPDRFMAPEYPFHER